MADQEGTSALHRDIGRLEGRMDALETGQEAMKAELNRFESKLDKIGGDVGAIRETIAGAKGSVQAGWWTGKTIMGLIGAGGGAAIVYLASIFGSK